MKCLNRGGYYTGLLHGQIGRRTNGLKGLIIPIHILRSDKNPWGNVTKTHEGGLLPRVFWSHFRDGFRQT